MNTDLKHTLCNWNSISPHVFSVLCILCDGQLICTGSFKPGSKQVWFTSTQQSNLVVCENKHSDMNWRRWTQLVLSIRPSWTLFVAGWKLSGIWYFIHLTVTTWAQSKQQFKLLLSVWMQIFPRIFLTSACVRLADTYSPLMKDAAWAWASRGINAITVSNYEYINVNIANCRSESIYHVGRSDCLVLNMFTTLKKQRMTQCTVKVHKMSVLVS